MSRPADVTTAGFGDSATVPAGVAHGDAAAGSARGAANLAATDPLLGAVVGDVRIERVIGAGGMGRVYEGRQLRPGRQVAVKVIRPGTVSPARLRRFEFEAELLGSLRHPGIAAIHAAGTHAFHGESLPFFVMELVPDGRPITRYCDGGLPLHRKLELFQGVCDAVAHGHQKGVIHRDLKPGNILVGSDGRPKVIDFGIARTTGTDLAVGELALTTTAAFADRFLGTLEYMSPEQFGTDEGDLDVRADVYALGVVLYELLAGRPPHDLRDTPLVEAITVVRERDPPPLAVGVQGLTPALAAIVGTCLAKDRRRRYGSAAELAADIGRYLAGEPVTARPPGAWESLLRIVRRHRVAAAIAASLLAAGLVAAAGITTFAVRAERARREAVAERARADAEAEAARRQLAVANLHRISGLIRSGGLTAARSLFADTEALTDGRPRLELRILAADLDRAVVASDGGAGPLRSLRFSPAGGRLAAVAESGGVRVWRVGWTDSGAGAVAGDGPVTAREGRPRARMWLSSPEVLGDAEGPFTTLAFSPDGTQLAAGGLDHAIRIWDLEGEAGPTVLRGHAHRLESLRFSGDGRLLASCGWDRTARLWDWRAGREVAVLRGHDGRVVRVEFTPTGDRLVTASNDATARVWDVATGAAVATLRGHEGLLYDLRLSPDGTRVATASLDTTARIWDVATGRQEHVLRGHGGWVRGVAFSPDGMRLATASEDRTGRVWDAATGGQVGETRLSGNIHGISYSPDGRRIVAASGDGNASVWDAAGAGPPDVLRGHGGGVTNAAFSPDGRMLATTSVDGTLRLWDAERPGRLPALVGHGRRVRAVRHSPDGRLVVTVTQDGLVRLWDAATGDPLGVLGEPAGTANGIAFAAGGRLLAVTGGDGDSRTDECRTVVWNVADRAVRSSFTTTGFPIGLGGVLSPDGGRSVTRLPGTGPPGSIDDPGLSTAALWDARDGRRVATLAGHTAFIAQAAFAHDGRRLATASYDGTLRLWDADTGSLLAVLEGHRDWVMGVAFSPDDRLLASCSFDGTARLWHATTGAAIAVLEGHADKIRSLAFAPAGGRLATVSEDLTTRIWDVATRRVVAVCRGHAHQVRGAAFSPDGTRLITLGAEGTARICDAETGEELVVLPHEAPVEAVSFAPDGLSLVTLARGDVDVRIWGRPASWLAADDGGGAARADRKQAISWSRCPDEAGPRAARPEAVHPSPSTSRIE